MRWFYFTCLLLSLTATGRPQDELWELHTIDNSSRGADGVRLADVNSDGLLDIATGWEEGGVIRVYLNPGPRKAVDPWPKVTVGRVKSPEDAVFADLDEDGSVDVVSSCEGRTRTMFFHWAPGQQAYLDENSWQTAAVPATRNAQSWMFALPMDVDGRNGIDLIVSSKGGGASIGWLQSPENPRDTAAWKYHRLRDAGWIMSLEAFDMDGDGDLDVIASDRKGAKRGVLWLENPGPEACLRNVKWKDHSIGGESREVMFLDVARGKGGTLAEILVAAKPVDFLRIARGEGFTPWSETVESLPAGKLGTAKSVRRGDINLDGIPDFVFSCEQAKGSKTGLVWLQGRTFGDPMWSLRELAGPAGVKYDLIQLVDLDSDGDLDVICCEERANLGVFWYENPTQ